MNEQTGEPTTKPPERRTPVYLRIGDRPLYELGTMPCDEQGRVRSQDVAGFLLSCGDHILTELDNRDRESDDDD